MTQMYGKWALILAFFGLFCGLLAAQDTDAIPILLESENQAQKEQWQAALKAEFADQTLIWVDEAKDADLVVSAQEDEQVNVWLRQNAVQRLSPILEPAPSVVLPADDAVAVAALLWPLTEGRCDIPEEKTALDTVDEDVRAVYEGNCALIAAAEADDPETLHNTAFHAFEQAVALREARTNRVWLVHETGDTAFTRELISLEILTPDVTDADAAFWYAKRGQFAALDFDFQAALRDFDRAIALMPDDPRLLTLKGEVYLLLYEWNNAKAAFDGALALESDYAPAYFQRGILLSTMTETKKANADFSQYLALEPRGVYADLARQYGGAG